MAAFKIVQKPLTCPENYNESRRGSPWKTWLLWRPKTTEDGFSNPSDLQQISHALKSFTYFSRCHPEFEPQNLPKNRSKFQQQIHPTVFGMFIWCYSLGQLCHRRSRGAAMAGGWCRSPCTELLQSAVVLGVGLRVSLNSIISIVTWHNYGKIHHF